MDYHTNAAILAQALPYIQQWQGKKIVVKYGGNAMLDERLKMAVIRNVILLSCVGIKVVLVHGGGPEISDMLAKIHKESRFVNGLRYTDGETMDIVQMVLCGKTNKNLVGLINTGGGRAVGLSGVDGGMMTAERLTEDGVDYGQVGDVTDINPELIDLTLDAGYIPVIATVATSPSGEAYNVNADTAAARIAAAIGAEKLVLLTDVRGLLRTVGDDGSLISEVDVTDVPQLERTGVITGGMIPKVNCCVEAVRRGVKRTHIIDGRIENSILIELLSDAGIGTMIY